jgi:small-conductance mechanosensitive channel
MWYETWLENLTTGLQEAGRQLPTIAVAVLLVLLGWGLAHLGRRWSRAISETLLERLGASSRSLGRAVESSGARGNTPRIVSAFVFWIVLLVFVAAAVEVVGLPRVTELIGRLATYVPNLLAASLIILGGLILARVVRAAVLRAAESGGVAQAPTIAAASEGIVIVLAAVIALEQLGISGRVLELTVTVVIGSALAAIALAFGLGARSSVANLIAAHYVTRMIRIGQTLEIEGTRGTVIELTSTAVVLETVEGRVVVPAQRFDEATTVIVDKEA